jgi:aspartokinase-like uncharacterized kinase
LISDRPELSLARIIKVGGSLYDLPDLAQRLAKFLITLPQEPFLLVPGGGITADAVRQLDRCHGLGEERAHWLALRALSLNARLLVALFENAIVVSDSIAALESWRAGRVPILDVFEFAAADESNDDHLPHSWKVTSDSFACRAAMSMGASELIFLKSAAITEPFDLVASARSGLIDEHCPDLLRAPIRVRAFNLRQSQE